MRRKGNIALEATKLNGENPAPSAGYAKAICQYFDLPNTSPRLKKLLLQTEKESINKGKSQKEKTKPALGVVMMEDGTEIRCDKDLIALAADHAHEAAQTGAPIHTVVVGNEHTYVVGGGIAHQDAHSAAREVRPGTEAWGQGRRGQFDCIKRLVEAARGDRGWQERAVSQRRPFSDPSYDR